MITPSPIPLACKESAPHINILHLLQRFRIGGKEEVVKTLLLSPSHNFVSYACALQTIGFMAEQVRNEGKTVFHIDLTCRIKRFQNLVRLFKLIRHYQFSTIFCHDISSWFYAALLSRFIRKTRIVHVRHSFLENESFKTLITTRLLSLCSYKLVAVSDSIKKSMIIREKIPSHKIAVIHNGIDVRKYSNQAMRQSARRRLNIPDGSFVSGTVSRFFPVKNIEAQIDMVGVLKDRIADYLHVIVAPITEYGEKLKQEAVKRNLDKHIFFLGFRDDIPDVLSTFDAFVLTSLSEGTPMVLLEAMASGCPVVTSAVGGNVDIINHRFNGLLYDVHNLDALCDAIMLLHSNPGLRSTLASNASDHIRSEYSLDNMIAGYELLAAD